MHSASWGTPFWASLRKVVEQQISGAGPRVNRLVLSDADAPKSLLLKLYPPEGGMGRLKDLFRASKARRYWRQALSFEAHGFPTPLVWAVGERRAWRRLEMAFIVTELLPAHSLSVYLWGDTAGGLPRLSAREKWTEIRELGRQVGRMHRLGFVHGDLVLSNILVQRGQDGTRYYYIDHDRTRRYPRWFPQTLWKRNLVQLNRLLLPGISLQDRVRFFQAYLEGRERKYGSRERNLLRWLGRRTIARRKETRRPGREARGPRPRECGELRIGED